MVVEEVGRVEVMKDPIGHGRNFAFYSELMQSYWRKCHFLVKLTLATVW